MIHKIVIPGTPPSKKNSRNIFRHHGRIFNIPSKRYESWQDSIKVVLLKSVHFKDPIEYAQLCFYVGDRRRRDLTNMAESIMDSMVDYGVIQDDCWQVIPEIRLMLYGVDKENPRTEVLIEVVQKLLK